MKVQSQLITDDRESEMFLPAFRSFIGKWRQWRIRVTTSRIFNYRARY